MRKAVIVCFIFEPVITGVPGFSQGKESYLRGISCRQARLASAASAAQDQLKYSLKYD